MLAQEEARLLNHNFIGTEHILLGLVREGDGVAAKALESLGISLERVRDKVGETIGPTGSATTGAALYPPGQKGPRTVAARSPAAWPQLHRYRAHAPRPGPRRRGRRRPSACQPGRRPVPGAPPGHPTPLRRPVAGGSGSQSG